jgi:dihydrofolate reductase
MNQFYQMCDSHAKFEHPERFLMLTEKLNIDALNKSIDIVTSCFLELVEAFSQEDINRIPFENSWTAAQVAEHVTRSNIGIIKSLRQPGKAASRALDEGVQRLKDLFLNFEKKLKSPEFILPTRRIYDREWVITHLKNSILELKDMATGVNHYEAIDHPIFGDITKYELLHFVIYHTQRHIHQLTNISRRIETTNPADNRRVILFIHMSLDGFVAGPNGETDWITIDDEIFKDANALANTADIALYGRTTFQMMESYWPTVLTNSNSTPLELEHAVWMERVKKIVFSTTLERVEWTNTTLVKDNIGEEMTRLKQQPGRNMIIFGSPCLAHNLMERGLVDRFRINVNPVVLGEGIPLFKNADERIHLRLLQSKRFHSDVVGLLYERKID